MSKGGKMLNCCKSCGDSFIEVAFWFANEKGGQEIFVNRGIDRVQNTHLRCSFFFK